MTVRLGQIDLFTKRVRKPPAAAEFKLHCMVADMLRDWCSRDWRYTHIPLGEYRPDATAGRLKRMGVMPGWSDFVLLSPWGVTHFLELKRRGGRMSWAQEDFAAYCKAHGYVFAWHDKFDDAINTLKRWGALRANVSV